MSKIAFVGASWYILTIETTPTTKYSQRWVDFMLSVSASSSGWYNMPWQIHQNEPQRAFWARYIYCALVAFARVTITANTNKIVFLTTCFWRWYSHKQLYHLGTSHFSPFTPLVLWLAYPNSHPERALVTLCTAPRWERFPFSPVAAFHPSRRTVCCKEITHQLSVQSIRDIKTDQVRELKSNKVNIHYIMISYVCLPREYPPAQPSSTCEPCNAYSWLYQSTLPHQRCEEPLPALSLLPPLLRRRFSPLAWPFLPWARRRRRLMMAWWQKWQIAVIGAGAGGDGCWCWVLAMCKIVEETRRISQTE